MDRKADVQYLVEEVVAGIDSLLSSSSNSEPHRVEQQVYFVRVGFGRDHLIQLFEELLPPKKEPLELIINSASFRTCWFWLILLR